MSKHLEAILEKGWRVPEPDSNCFAVTRLQMKEVLEEAERIQIALLGGDVYYQSNSGITSGTESWYCDRERGEPYSNFVARSIDISREYLKEFDAENPLTALFAPVFDDA